MKKVFLILLILLVSGSPTSVWGQCPDTLDHGECDTLYVEPWPDDLVWTGGAGPYFVRVPIYVTTDVVEFFDSIPAFVVPLCFTHTNPASYCSLGYFWNDTNLPYIPPNWEEHSIFRDLEISPGDTLFNRMADFARTGQSWSNIILNLGDLTSHFWLAMIRTAQPGWGEGSRVLLATMTFKLEDSMTVCIDTCFWPPSSHLAFVTDRPGGPAKIKIPKSGSGDPYNFEVCFKFEPPDPVDCDRSYFDPCLVACPLGDIPFRVYLKDSNGSPIANYSNIWLDMSGCSGIVPCATETSWPIVHPDGPSDANGVLTFHLHAGGCDNIHFASVMAKCGLIGYVSIKTVDTDGDLVVSVSDWHGIGVDPCNDYNCNQEINYWDLDFFKDHITHGSTIDPCLLLSQDLTVIPDTLLPMDSTHEVRLVVKNNYSEPCTAQYVKFYSAGFRQGSGLVQFAPPSYLWQELLPGDTAVAEADFVVPGDSSGYILTKFYTDCCEHSLDAIFDFTERMCPPDSMVYIFPIVMDYVPTFVEILEYIPERWYWLAYETGGIPDSVAIVTPDSSALGVTGGVTLYFYDQNWNLLGHRTCEVRLTLNNGDANSDCEVSVGDVVYLISYLFKFGLTPDPLRAGDVNCDCQVSVDDVVYLISYLFRSGPPPVSSETCECGYKEWFPY